MTGARPCCHADPAGTAANLDTFAAGDGQAWLDMFAEWQRIRDPLLDALFTPFPPIRAALVAAAPAEDRRHHGPGPARGAAGSPAGRREFSRRGRGTAVDRQRHAQRHPAGRRGQRRLRLVAVHARPGCRLPGAAGRVGKAGPGFAVSGGQGRRPDPHGSPGDVGADRRWPCRRRPLRGRQPGQGPARRAGGRVGPGALPRSCRTAAPPGPARRAAGELPVGPPHHEDQLGA